MNPIIALDIGEKRIGLALCDEKKNFSFPTRALKNDSSFEKEFEEVVKKRGIEKIVVGLPRNMDGSYGRQAEKIKEFVSQKLKKYQSMIEYEDETLTSELAKKVMRRQGLDPDENKERIDSYAAKIILEGYLERIKESG